MWNTEDVPSVYLAALCAWREARGCSEESIRGVLHVMRNRVQHGGFYGKSYPDVILKPFQFSSFNTKDPNATKFPASDDRKFHIILEITEKVLNGQDEDLTGGAVLYHDVDVFPDWAAKAIQTAKIGPFTFYKEA